MQFCPDWKNPFACELSQRQFCEYYGRGPVRTDPTATNPTGYVRPTQKHHAGSNGFLAPEERRTTYGRAGASIRRRDNVSVSDSESFLFKPNASSNTPVDSTPEFDRYFDSLHERFHRITSMLRTTSPWFAANVEGGSIDDVNCLDYPPDSRLDDGGDNSGFLKTSCRIITTDMPVFERAAPHEVTLIKRAPGWRHPHSNCTTFDYFPDRTIAVNGTQPGSCHATFDFEAGVRVSGGEAISVPDLQTCVDTCRSRDDCQAISARLDPDFFSQRGGSPAKCQLTRSGERRFGSLTLPARLLSGTGDYLNHREAYVVSNQTGRHGLDPNLPTGGNRFQPKYATLSKDEELKLTSQFDESVPPDTLFQCRLGQMDYCDGFGAAALSNVESLNSSHKNTEPSSVRSTASKPRTGAAFCQTMPCCTSTTSPPPSCGRNLPLAAQQTLIRPAAVAGDKEEHHALLTQPTTPTSSSWTRTYSRAAKRHKHLQLQQWNSKHGVRERGRLQ